MNHRRLWTAQEDQIIINLVKEHGTKKWTTVAEDMKKYVSQFVRSSKQIRQRWHNHLDPKVNKKQWTIQEQNILFKSHRQLGSRWKQIANKLSGRTDNHVKNYFYSTMRRALRRMNKYIGSKNSTTQMRTIRPSILSYLLDIADNDIEIRSLVSKILEFSKFKPKKLGNIIPVYDVEQKNNFQLAINKLMELNQTYSRKGNRKITQLQQFKFLPQKNNTSPQTYHTKSKLSQNRQNQAKQKQQVIQQNNEQFAQLSWSNQQQQQSYTNKQMPQLQKPQYQCDLLTKKQQHNQSNHHIQFYFHDTNWSNVPVPQLPTLETTYIFEL